MHLTLAISLWFIFISQGSSANADPSKDDPASSDMCSAIMCQFSLEDKALNQLLVKDIITEFTDCSCEISTYPTIPDISFEPCSITLLSSFCTSDLHVCFCTNLYLSVSPACNSTYTKQNCPIGSNQNFLKKYSCQTFKNFTLGPSPQFSSDCSIGQNDKDSDFIVQWKATGLTSRGLEYMSGEVMCNAESVRPTPPGPPPTSRTTVTPISTTDASTRPTTITPTTRNYTSANTTAELENQSGMIIGIVVGVGGAVLITAIIIVMVVLRRRRVESSKLHANNGSKANAVVPNETAYASYTIPVSAAYDNATNGTTSNYESIAGDNEEVGESNHAYTEVKEISDHNGYDNSETGRSDVFSMCRETGENYEIVSENPTANTESETTVIDNEFYG